MTHLRVHNVDTVDRKRHALLELRIVVVEELDRDGLADLPCFEGHGPEIGELQ